MANVTDINHNCKHCKKELHPDTHNYYKCDGCRGIICEDCHQLHEGKDLCKHCHHKETNRVLGMPAGSVKIAAFVGTLILLAVFFTWFSNSASPTGYASFINNYQSNEDAGASLDLFVMSQCPYGVQAEDLVMPVVEKFGSDMNFNLYFIAKKSGDSFSSLHGQVEVDEDIRQLSIIKNNPDKFFDYLKCFNENYQDAENSFETCAAEVGLDIEAIKSFAKSDEAKELFAENIKKADELSVGGSPTFILNNVQYSGARTESAITRALCEAVPAADACKNLEAAKPVLLKIVNDKDCEPCDTTEIIAQLKGLVLGLKTKDIAYDSNEGKGLIESFEVITVPMLVFESSIEESDGYETLQGYLIRQGDDYLLKTGGVKMLDRETEPNNLKLFIMSQCPYGTMAQETLKEVAEAMPELDWEIYFIASQSESGSFDSLHGQPEVDEDIRQVCILRYEKDKYLDYTEEYKKKYDTCGEEMMETQDYVVYEECIANIDSSAAMTKAGINTAQIMLCEKGIEGLELFSENIKLANNLQIGQSPTFLLNNNIKGGGYTAEDLKESICSVNPEMDGCEQTLSENRVAASGGQC